MTTNAPQKKSEYVNVPPLSMPPPPPLRQKPTKGINECMVIYECNMKRMRYCKYYFEKEKEIDCIHRNGLHCCSIPAIKEALKDENEITWED